MSCFLPVNATTALEYGWVYMVMDKKDTGNPMVLEIMNPTYFEFRQEIKHSSFH